MFDRYIFGGQVIPNLSFGGPGCLGIVFFAGKFWSFTNLILFDIMRPHFIFSNAATCLLYMHGCAIVYTYSCRYKMRNFSYLHKLPLCE